MEEKPTYTHEKSCDDQGLPNQQSFDGEDIRPVIPQEQLERMPTNGNGYAGRRQTEKKNIETRRANSTLKRRHQTEMRMRVVHGEDFQ